ncbi:MAG: hypothetical protein FJW96_08565 [Actinobacteria bacterium]|nr:hypothetical protein [Actinomycetota bacterium]
MEAWGGTRGHWRHPSPRFRLGLLLVLAALAGTALTPPIADLVGYRLPYGGEREEAARKAK